MKIGLFFGSFNPVHIGHMIIANTLIDEAALDEVWMVVSPQNPFKQKNNLLDKYDRLHLINLAINNCEGIRASDIEFGLPTPSYTIDTLTHLKEKHPTFNFHLIIGSDNVGSIKKWKNADVLLKEYGFIIYSRSADFKLDNNIMPNAIVPEVPLLNISSTYIRSRIKEGLCIKFLVPEKVEDYILKENLYR